APAAQRIAAARRFDLDHLGAEIAQHLGREGAGDQLSHLEYAYPGQGFVHVLPPFHFRRTAGPQRTGASGAPAQAATSARPQATPEAQAHWKLYPPSQPVTSTASPTTYRPGRRRACMLR